MVLSVNDKKESKTIETQKSPCMLKLINEQR